MGFIRFLPLRTSTTSTRYTPWSTGNAAVGTENGARTWVPLSTSVGDGTIRVTTAVTSTQRYDVDFQVALVVSGSTIQITSAVGGGLGNLGTFGATLPAFSDPGNSSATRHLVSGVKQNTPPNQDVRLCYEYTVPSADDVSWFGSGDSDSAITLAGTERFMALEWSGTTTASTTTESVSQVAWPAAGVFKYLIVRYIVSDPVTLNLRKNGASVITLAMPAGTNVFASDLATQVSVSPGDLMNWRFIRNSGADTSLQMVIVIGFAGTGVT